ncbi:uncharacterized protein [Lepeophtheirus salmonis]|uniref:uncharacterized protein isoform X2 n=1 Tax=Lepeophtheirus salmonis TaxID=72036 RepID=UPI001AE353A6|nr:uncharacterized protein LOC121126614 isoform X1 [Lepeophtheirus salmonis]
MKKELRNIISSKNSTRPGMSRKYSRTCKDNAKALVALVVADENFQFDKQFGSIRSSRTNQKAYDESNKQQIIQHKLSHINNKSFKKSLSLEERLKKILIQDIVEKSGTYFCLTCGSTFEDYCEIQCHRNKCVSQFLMMSYSSSSPWWYSYSSLKRRRIGNSKASTFLDNYLQNAIKVIPESSFNNLHGTIYHINSVDGYFLKTNPKIRTVNKVKLNLSGSWKFEEVWKGGWDETFIENSLSWKTFGDINFLKNMSVFSWNEQIILKKHFKKWLSSRSVDLVSNQSHKADFRKWKRFLSSLELQTALPMKKNRKAPPTFSGEWEYDRTYICSVCSHQFDDLEEVMHHKWEEHPYCLVSHITLLNSIHLPPHQMYPQVGVASLNSIGTEFSCVKRCSKCLKVFDNYIDINSPEAFYVHLLTCGGDLESASSWSVRRNNQGGKRRRKRTTGVIRSICNKHVDELRKVERERRKRRLEIFSKPRPPIARITRLQLKSNTTHLYNLEDNSMPSFISECKTTNTSIRVSNISCSEIIVDLFDPSEIFIKYIIEDVLSRVLDLKSGKKRGRPTKTIKRRRHLFSTKKRKRCPLHIENTKYEKEDMFSSPYSDPPIFARKSSPNDSVLIYAKKSLPNDFSTRSDQKIYSGYKCSTFNEFASSSSQKDEDAFCSLDLTMINVVDGFPNDLRGMRVLNGI